jgi:hypothetical protein
VDQDGITVVQRYPQVLATPSGHAQGVAAKPGGEVVRSGQMAAYGTGGQHDDLLDARAGDVSLEAGADDLHLGKLRHDSVV